MTAQEFAYMLEGHNEAEAEKLDQINFQVRRLAYYMIAPHIEKGKGIASEMDMWPHKWDADLEKARRNSLPISKVEYDGE